MNRTVSRYLERRTQSEHWPLQNAPIASCLSIVVIPALGEYPGLLDTLSDLSACPESGESLAIVVVNNRSPEHSSAQDIALNSETLTALQEYDQQRLRIAWIDASSPDCELPAKEGVGLARKLGLDWGLQILADQQRLDAPLICLDGDTRVDTAYLKSIHAFFEAPSRWAAVLPYAHPIVGDDTQQAAILCYEFFLRYHAAQLTWAGSPYGYHAIGSAMACTGVAYAAISGMNRRQAGEDFYFLQQLAKTGTIEQIDGTTVLPSGRPSHRVPFGTGRRVQRFLDGALDGTLDGTADEYVLYHADSYEIIRRWLSVATESDQDGEALTQAARAIHPELGVFLVAQKFGDAWNRMRAQSSDTAARRAQFHEWFDGFRTLKCIHHLRDTAYPDAPMFAAIASLLARESVTPGVELTTALTHDLPAQKLLLEQLRDLSLSRNLSP